VLIKATKDTAGLLHRQRAMPEFRGGYTKPQITCIFFSAGVK